MPKDDLGRQIAVMLALHPDVASTIGTIDLTRMDEAAKRLVLTSIQNQLGIHEPRTRRLTEVYD